MLDLEPYTAEGITSREKGLGPSSPLIYNLTGIIVHQGQASAGHYYAFIKTKGKNTFMKATPLLHKATPTIPEEEEMETIQLHPLQEEEKEEEQWLKFNDTLVERFIIDEFTLETECFGGSVRSNSSDPVHTSHPESRVRHWNAYMLFYEAANEIKKTQDTRKEQDSPVTVVPTMSSEDNLSQLQELVTKGEKRGVFNDNIPSTIQRSVNTENLHFMQNRDVYCREYFEFIRNLTFCNDSLANVSLDPSGKECGRVIVELATKFLLFTFLRTYKELR
ncbi:PREDICTED: ubiquitin carboxyl-terminal hydrolase 24-like [Amphimedon queenslandica]|uniref:USP domain-containing protein n=1 Tax=Amphimedon queenslandica TaxID=400682 RepID=A0AAN0JSA8_AMPQE|nr:PREDICTED: ubiquitin carboxyl-terminal hydrolase 24-like [Amphimedon queenslandica]|eukprot:XP_019859988.1 PREDICTED: ubiquitin carboxyl-terminal hydrolase 24-like [Amphimedon queenslandica]